MPMHHLYFHIISVPAFADDKIGEYHQCSRARGSRRHAAERHALTLGPAAYL